VKLVRKRLRKAVYSVKSGDGVESGIARGGFT